MTKWSVSWASDVAKQLPAEEEEEVTNSIQREGDNHLKKKKATWNLALE